MQLFGNSEWLILMTAIIWVCGDKQMEAIKRVRLSEIAELITKGTTPTTLGYNFQEDGVNFLKIECFSEDGIYIKEKTAHISEECHEKLKRSKLRTGDILFSIAGAIGRVAVVTKEMLPANTNQALAIIRVTRDDIYLPYIKLILTSQIVKAQFERKKQGVAQLNISLKDINELEIPLPEKSKQIECASLLEKISGIITARQQQLQKLDELVKARFVELFGMINEDVSLSYYIASLNAGKSLAGEEENPNKVLKTGAVTYDYFDATQIKNLPMDYEPQEGHRVKVGDVIISRMNTAELVGAAAYVWDVPEHIYLPDRLWRAEIKETANPIFVWQVLIQRSTKKSIRRIASGTSGSMKNISKPGLLGIRVVKAPIKLQEQFAAFVEQTDKSKVAIQKALDEAQLLFDSLMQKYFG